jgi:hypothetical protein
MIVKYLIKDKISAMAVSCINKPGNLTGGNNLLQ